MGVNTASVTKVLVTNVEAANTGTSLANIANGDLLVLNKNMSVLTGTPTVAQDGNDTVYLALGLAGGKFELSAPIQVSGILSVKTRAYAPAVKQASSFTFPAPVAGKTYQLVVLRKDEHRVHVQRQTRRFYDVVAAAGETATTLAAKFAAKINRDAAACVTAGAAAAVLTLTAKDVPTTYMDQVARILFDAALNMDGAKVVDLVQVAAPNRGNGTPELLRELEESTLRRNRIAHPIIDPKLKAVDGNGYNTLTIMHRNEYNGDFSGVVSSPLTSFVAFKTTVTADVHGPSAKQTAALNVLESLFESAGKFVK